MITALTPLGGRSAHIGISAVTASFSVLVGTLLVLGRGALLPTVLGG